MENPVEAEIATNKWKVSRKNRKTTWPKVGIFKSVVKIGKIIEENCDLQHNYDRCDLMDIVVVNLQEGKMIIFCHNWRKCSFLYIKYSQATRSVTALVYHILASVAVVWNGGSRECSWLCKVAVDRNVE